MNMMPLLLALDADAHTELFTPLPSRARPNAILNTLIQMDNVRPSGLYCLAGNQFGGRHNGEGAGRLRPMREQRVAAGINWR
jgi:hypothetical protein